MKELGPILAAELDGKDFLCGVEPTIADLAIGSSITQLAFADAVPPHANVAAWHQRVAALEGVRKSMPAV